jgi:SAM-dependent methyltransferase
LLSDEPAIPDYSLYRADYHDAKAPGSRLAADAVLPIVLAVVDAASVLDVGCGYGTWLAAARELGVTDLTGIEGTWAAAWRDRGVLATEFDLVLCDLEAPLRLGRRFDLVLCVEVAEHLTAPRGSSFVADLCAVGSAVLLSAAIPGQHGINHVNERWASEWAAEFARHGYRALDCIRPQVWGDSSLPWYYRQNPLLFVTADVFADAQARAEALPAPGSAAIDVVHPEAYLQREPSTPLPSAFDSVQPGACMQTEPVVTLRQHLRLLAQIPGAARRSLDYHRNARRGRRSS